MFKKGDKVKILKKSTGYRLDETPFKVGDIGVYQNETWDKDHCIFQIGKTVQWNFADGDFVHQEIKLGDKVEVLSKSVGKSLEHSPYKKGDIITINYIEENGLYHKGIEYSSDKGLNLFLETDLRKIEDTENIENKEKKMYKFKKELYVIDILKSNAPSSAEKKRFYNWVVDKNIDLTLPIKMTDDFVDKFEKSLCFKDWLYKEDYLEKFKPFTIPIEITSDRMYWTLWHRIMLNGDSFLSKYTEQKQKEGNICDIENTDVNTLFNLIDKTEYRNKVDNSKK